ncbi:hypothetical protein [Streptomyces sp. DW26H14]|uniref:hypothetical protein n=1 Tax=Streptomyces sp. DW26H14 TaxID=3435395 RepID=UPI00403DDDAB
MTATATTAPPTKARKTTPRTATKTTRIEHVDEAELRRYTPDEVVAKQLLPYKSVRVLRRKCYARQVIHHNDGGRISFTLDDIRRENARTAVEPIAA